MFILYVYAFKIAPDVMIHQKLLDWWAVSADETGKFHDQLDCLNVALTDHQIQISHVILFQNELHFQGKRILMRQNVSFSAFKSRGIKENKNNNETEARQYKKNSFLYLTKT